jgi:hypothetical protein
MADEPAAVLIQESHFTEEFIRSLDDRETGINVHSIQSYSPLYDQYVKIGAQDDYQKFGLKSKYKICSISNTFSENDDGQKIYVGQITDSDGNTRDARFVIKKNPILEPVKYMRGIYDTGNSFASLPATKARRAETIAKTMDVNNEAYTESFFIYLASKLTEDDIAPHFPLFYGAINGISRTFKYNMTDEIDDFQEEAWFYSNVGRIFTIDSSVSPEFLKEKHSRNLPPLNDLILDSGVSGETTLENGVEIAVDDGDIAVDDGDIAVDDGDIAVDDGDDDVINLDDDDIQDIDDEQDINDDDDVNGEEQEDEDDDGDEDDGDEDDGDDDVNSDEQDEDDGNVNSEEQEDSEDGRSSSGGSSDYSSDGSYASDNGIDFYAIFHEFPVQMTFMEACDGTLDSLIFNETYDEVRWRAYLFQVIFATAILQKHYDFTHNDLHTSNILYCNTEITELYYKIGDKVFCVPTFGKIMKIIDYGRAIYKYNGIQHISDAFHENNDAGDQYNFGLYYNSRKPRVIPNPSFDLARLSASLIEDLFPSPPQKKVNARILCSEPGRKPVYETKSEVYNLLYTWVVDKFGKYILRTPSGAERFPGFELYKVIARRIKSAVPTKQFDKPMFNIFEVDPDDVPTNQKIYSL